MKKWKVLSSETLVALNQFSFKKEVCELPDKRTMPGYYILDFKNPWVHILALTEEKEIILIEQYRHATRSSFLELPGGSADKKSETPETCALRELEEETGYSTSEKLKEIGTYCPNPALQSNQVHVYLAENCKKIGEQKLDPFEDISVKLISLDKLDKLFTETQTPQHGLMLSSLYLARKFL